MTPDPVTRLLANAEALRCLASLLDEKENGVSCILEILAKDLKECGELLNDCIPIESESLQSQHQ